MIIIIVELLVSGVLLWLYDKRKLWILGFKPTRKRIVDFTFGFFISALLYSLCLYPIINNTKQTITLNPDFTFMTFLNSSFWMLKSVLGEELLFRGALLFIGIQKLGLKNACILSSIIFGMYHWFSYGIFGDFPQMIYIFFLTGIGGLLFASSFALTKSIYLPVGLHLGWNLIGVVIFSGGPLGKQMFIFSDGQQLDGLWTALFFIYQITLLPFVTYLYLKRQKHKPTWDSEKVGETE